VPEDHHRVARAGKVDVDFPEDSIRRSEVSHVCLEVLGARC
jgi:hypothetical protein